MKRREPTLLERFLEEATHEGEPLEVAELFALSAEAMPVPPPLRDRLERSLESTHRFDDLEGVVAEIADLPIDRARALLLSIDAPSTRWEPGPGEGIELLHFVGGEKVKDAVTGVVRHAPGARFPEHDHVGDETVLILQGECVDDDGSIYRAGDVAPRGPGSPHSYRAVGPLPLLTLAVVHGGVVVGGEIYGPSDPRA